jgi:hypothetical protein
MHVKVTALCTLVLFFATAAHGQIAPITASAQRPVPLFNRWQEDWSVLANPNVSREPLDSLKYIPLSKYDPRTYLSFGANLRERYESNDAINFGAGPASKSQSYVISRMEVDADLHIAGQIQAFVQLQSDFSPGKTIILPVDQDRLGVEQAFVTITEPVGIGIFKFRVGRQQFAFDLQRFVSVRDGPNVRQSCDAAWADYEISKWRFITFYSQPVQNRNIRAFDDYSSGHLTYGGFRVERKIADIGRLSSYISHFKQDHASFPSASGNERRQILDVRFAGKADAFDWDLETMGQVGHITNKNIRAWAIGTLSGYTFEKIIWQPRLGLQFDAASGNHNPTGNTLGTFNPLFPNGEYLTLAGYTGYTNFIHLKPSLTLKPLRSLTAKLAVAAQWRETIADAVYTQPDIPVPGTVGKGGRYTGTYFQARLDWQMSPHVHNAFELVRFNVASAIRQAGGRDATYVGLESKLAW